MQPDPEPRRTVVVMRREHSAGVVTVTADTVEEFEHKIGPLAEHCPPGTEWTAFPVPEGVAATAVSARVFAVRPPGEGQ